MIPDRTGLRHPSGAELVAPNNTEMDILSQDIDGILQGHNFITKIGARRHRA
jgi:hypothetical protein